MARYQKRISGPLLDRVDVFVEVSPVEYEKLIEDQSAHWILEVIYLDEINSSVRFAQSIFFGVERSH